MNSDITRRATPESLAEISFGGSETRLQMWILFVLSGCRRTGMTPVSSMSLHTILFYGAVLTPVYGLSEPVPMIAKVQDTPFYPEAQKDIEKLIAFQKVCNFGRRRIGRFSDALSRRDGDSYELSPGGKQLVELLRKSHRAETLYRFILDLCKGYAELQFSNEGELMEKDALFGEGGLKRGEVARIRKSGTNKVRDAARKLADFEDAGFRPNRQDEIALYFCYLNELRRGAA